MENEKKETLGQQLGRLGGLATSRTHDRAHYQRMALKSALVRRKKSKKYQFAVKFASTNDITVNDIYTNKSYTNEATTN